MHLVIETFSMKAFLLLVIIQVIYTPVQAINGVIWSKARKDFIPIFSIEDFDKKRQEVFEASRSFETHNFRGKTLRFTYPQEQHIVEYIDGGKRISGIVGEVWTLLSESFNFTLKPVHTNIRTVGVVTTNSYSGMLNVAMRNETDIIGKVELYSTRLGAVRFSMPLWKNSHRLYIRRKVEYDRAWMLKLFSREVWCATLITYLALSLYSFGSQATVKRKTRAKKEKSYLEDHFFYNFGMICGQTYVPDTLSGRSRIFEVTLGLFSSVIKIAFSALLIGYMTRKIFVPPFHDINSLLNQTSYKVVMLAGSLPHIAVQNNVTEPYIALGNSKRSVLAKDLNELYSKGCSRTEKYAMFEGEDVKKSRGMYMCRLNPMGISYLEMWVGSGVSLNFQYKKTIDIGILRMHEYGLIHIFKERWLESKNIEEESVAQGVPLDIAQIFLAYAMFCTVALISLAILILENTVFYCSYKHRV